MHLGETKVSSQGRVDVDGFSRKAGRPSLRRFFGRHLKNKLLASVWPVRIDAFEVASRFLAHLSSVGAGSYFALLTWRSVGEEAEWELRSRANSMYTQCVSTDSGTGEIQAQDFCELLVPETAVGEEAGVEGSEMVADPGRLPP